MTTDVDGPARGVGRPSIAARRRVQVLDAFISLVGDHGLEAVTLDHVASAAGVQRAVIRHFVGNRRELIRDAVLRITELYEQQVHADIGSDPSIEELLALLFGSGWVESLAAYDRAFDALLVEATRHPETAGAVRRAYDVLLEAVAGAIARSRPQAAESAVRDAAYAITCMAEHNVTMIQLGYPSERSTACLAAARVIVESVHPTSWVRD